MEPNENPDEGFETSSAKTVIGFRDTPAFKTVLEDEAIEGGCENLSEYLRGIVRKRHEGKNAIEQLTKKNAEQQQEIEKLKEHVAAAGGKQFEVVQAENEHLRKIIKEQNNQLAIYSDQRLLYIYENVKGKKDIVEDAYHDNFGITYNSPQDVLRALIYSSKLNN